MAHHIVIQHFESDACRAHISRLYTIPAKCVVLRETNVRVTGAVCVARSFE